MGGLLRVPEIPRNHIPHSGNLSQLVTDFRDRQLEMLGADEKDIIGLPFQTDLEEPRHQLNETPGLLELLILFEERNDILESWVKGVSRLYLVGNRLGATIGGLDLAASSSLRPKVAATSSISALSGSDLKRRLRRMSYISLAARSTA